MKSPDEEVADKIIEAFRDETLLSEQGRQKLRAGLSSGKVSSEDWRLFFEVERPDKERNDAAQGQ